MASAILRGEAEMVDFNTQDSALAASLKEASAYVIQSVNYLMILNRGSLCGRLS